MTFSFPTFVSCLVLPDRFPLRVPRHGSNVKAQLHKRLAHMTSPRWTAPAPTMNDYHRHFPEVCTLISSFKAALPSDMRSQMERFEAPPDPILSFNGPVT